MTARFAIKVETTRDTAGNPRCGWLVYDRPSSDGVFVEAGYAGDHALTSVYPEFGLGGSRAVHSAAEAKVVCVLEITPIQWLRLQRAQSHRKD